MGHILCFALLFTVFPFTIQDESGVGNCRCAALNTQTSESIIDKPLPYDVTCNADGEERCRQLCIALGRHTQDHAADTICGQLTGHVENLYVGVYAKVCEEPDWKFTGLEVKAPICCHDGKSVPCRGLPLVIEA